MVSVGVEVGERLGGFEMFGRGNGRSRCRRREMRGRWIMVMRLWREDRINGGVLMWCERDMINICRGNEMMRDSNRIMGKREIM